MWLSRPGLLARRFLLRASLFRSFEVDDFRLPVSLLERDVVELRWRTEGRGGSAGGDASPVVAASGTRRRVAGSTRLEGLIVS